MLKSAKHEEMASEEINGGKCLSSTGSKHATLFPCVYALPISQKASKKCPSSYFNTLCSERKLNLGMITDGVIVETKHISVPQIRALTSRRLSGVNSGATALPTRVAFTITPLSPIKQSGHFGADPSVVTLLTTLIHFSS